MPPNKKKTPARAPVDAPQEDAAVEAEAPAAEATAVPVACLVYTEPRSEAVIDHLRTNLPGGCQLEYERGVGSDCAIRITTPPGWQLMTADELWAHVAQGTGIPLRPRGRPPG